MDESRLVRLLRAFETLRTPWDGGSSLESATTGGLRLVEAYIRAGHRTRAQTLVERILASSRETGYRYHESIALRLFGELLLPIEPAVSAEYLDRALEILGLIGARNDVASALATKGELRRASGDLSEAGHLLQRVSLRCPPSARVGTGMEPFRDLPQRV